MAVAFKSMLKKSVQSSFLAPAAAAAEDGIGVAAAGGVPGGFEELVRKQTGMRLAWFFRCAFPSAHAHARPPNCKLKEALARDTFNQIRTGRSSWWFVAIMSLSLPLCLFGAIPSLRPSAPASLSLSRSLSPALCMCTSPHTHSRTHARTHARARAHTHTRPTAHMIALVIVAVCHPPDPYNPHRLPLPPLEIISAVVVPLPDTTHFAFLCHP